MAKGMTAETSISINASPDRVWDALTNPDIIKLYLFGTQVTTDWKPGSPITYKGEWQGKPYEDKGIIKKLIPLKLLESTYWSSNSGKEDKPENYNTVTYQLEPTQNSTRVTIIQDNINSDKEKEHMQQNWSMVLGKMKEVVEGKMS